MTDAPGRAATRAARRLIVRTARSPLRPLWAALYAGVAQLVALVVAPPRSGTTVYVAGSLADGDPVYGLSDIDLVAVASDVDRAHRAQRRFETLRRVLPPLRGLIPHFWTYDERDLSTVLAGPYPSNGLDQARPVFLGSDAPRDPMALLERPGLYGAPQWRRLRGRLSLSAEADRDRLLSSWLELQYRWRYVLRAWSEESSVHGPALGAGLVAEAARIWLWLVHGERHRGKRASLVRATHLMAGERDGLQRALAAYDELHRSPAIKLAELLPSFVGITEAIAAHVDAEAFRHGGTEVRLLGDGSSAGSVPLLDWRALAFPPIDWSQPVLPFVVEERLLQVDANPADPAELDAASRRASAGVAPAIRRGSLLIEPTWDVWGWGRLRMVECAASSPVSIALLDGMDAAIFPASAAWSARSWALRAVAEHDVWLQGGRDALRPHAAWLGARPPGVWPSPATLGLLFAAARAGLFLESLDAQRPELPLTFASTVAALGARDPGLGADAAEAYAALETSRLERRVPPPEVVGRFRRLVEALPSYASRVADDAGRRPRIRVGSTRRERAATPAAGAIQAFRVKRGTNLSHWLSQTWQLTQPERMTAFSPDDAERIRDLGLDHVRLPVDEDVLWHADGRMDARGVAALRETVAWCLRADLRVIVDLHVVRSHRHLRSAPGLFEDPGDRALLAGLWADLADALADLPLDAVAYELLNEPTARDDEVWNEVAGLAIEAIRACEPSRMILLGSNRYNLFAALASLRVPDDPNLILGFHYYEPMAFTHYRAPWNRILAPYAGPITYPGRPVPEGELARLDPTLRRALEPLNRHLGRDQIRGDLSVPLAVARRTGLRLHCGELGVLNTVPDDLRLRWYRDVIDTLEESGIAWATWNLRGRFGLYDGDGPTVVHRAIAERRFARDGAAAAVPG